MAKLRSADRVQDSFDLVHDELVRVLKLSRGLERYKLSKRIKAAKSGGTVAKNGMAAERKLIMEYDILKGLDLDKVAEEHFFKTALRTKSIAKHLDDSQLSLATSKAVVNLTDPLTLDVRARLFSASEVRDLISTTIDGLKQSFESNPQSQKASATKTEVNGSNDLDSAEPDDQARSPWDSAWDSESDEAPMAPALKDKKRPQKIPASRPITATTSSSFLPSMSAGFVDYSDGSDLGENSEDDAWDSDDNSRSRGADQAGRKNRRGQRARQALWEKKFGTGANHVKAGSGAANGGLAKWDPKKGAVYGENGRTRRGPKAAGGRGSRQGAQGREGNFVKESGGSKATRKQDGTQRGGKRDDTGTLHPSWEAAKKRKLTSAASGSASATTFQGKKMVFD